MRYARAQAIVGGVFNMPQVGTERTAPVTATVKKNGPGNRGHQPKVLHQRNSPYEIASALQALDLQPQRPK
jgi:hypothetical protein